MESVFLSQSFADADRDLITAVVALLESTGLHVVTGEALGGAELSEGVRHLLEDSDACVGIATPREAKADGRFATHPWVQSELVMARTFKKRCIAIVSRDVDLQGAFTQNERIDYDLARPLPAIAKLARTLTIWRREAGRQIRIVPLPATVAGVIGKNHELAVCEYRIYSARGRPSPWRQAMIVPQQGGPVVHLEGATDDSFIEIRLQVGKQRWGSRAIQPFTHVTFKKEGKA